VGDTVGEGVALHVRVAVRLRVPLPLPVPDAEAVGEGETVRLPLFVALGDCVGEEDALCEGVAEGVGELLPLGVGEVDALCVPLLEPVPVADAVGVKEEVQLPLTVALAL
jgi:hypothetical protein